MALIKRADAETFARDAVRLHLGDLEREGESLIAEAKTRAESILAKGRAERDLLIAGAAERGYRAGFARGHAEGVEKGAERGEARALEGSSSVISSLTEQWGVLLAGFEARREAMLSDARRDYVRLAVVFAEKVARRAVDLDASVIERSLDEVVRRMVSPSALVVAVHPDDLAVAERMLPSLLERIGGSAHATVVSDGTLGRGGCVVRTDGGGVIDADIDAQIDRLIDAVLPADDACESGVDTEPGSGSGLGSGS